MTLKHSVFIFMLITMACQSVTTTPTMTMLPETKTPTHTPLPATSTHTPTLTFTPSPLPTKTFGPSLTPTVTPTLKPTKPTQGPGPGLTVRGYVRLENGDPVEGIDIHLAFAAYPGEIVATTNSNGYYSSEYIFIPGDELVRVWAEGIGYSFKPGDGSAAWTGTEFYWRHYHGYEDTSLSFIAVEEPVVK